MTTPATSLDQLHPETKSNNMYGLSRDGAPVHDDPFNDLTPLFVSLITLSRRKERHAFRIFVFVLMLAALAVAVWASFFSSLGFGATKQWAQDLGDMVRAWMRGVTRHEDPGQSHPEGAGCEV